MTRCLRVPICGRSMPGGPERPRCSLPGLMRNITAPGRVGADGYLLGGKRHLWLVRRQHGGARGEASTGTAATACSGFPDPAGSQLCPGQISTSRAAGSIALVGANASTLPRSLPGPARRSRESLARPAADLLRAGRGGLATWARSRPSAGRARMAPKSRGCCASRPTSTRAKKYPLVFVVHGGPSRYSGAYLTQREDLRYYPSLQFDQQRRTGAQAQLPRLDRGAARPFWS